MPRLDEISAQIASLNELREILGAIRAMAAAQMQQSQRSLDAIRNYVAIVRDALVEASSLLSEPAASPAATASSHPGLVVFGAEHGFCGAFNEPLLAAVASAVSAQPGLHLICVGSRAAQRAAEHGIRFDLTLPMTTHVGGVGAVARRVAAELYRGFAAGTLTALDAMYIRAAQAHQSAPRRLRLLPPEPLSPRQRPSPPPLVNVNPRQLRDEVGAEYMFAMLEACAMESFASENAARFRTMQAAHENIERKSTALDRLARGIRQEAITGEILELIGGVAATARA